MRPMQDDLLLPWSAHVKDCPPRLLPAEGLDIRNRAYPFANHGVPIDRAILPDEEAGPPFICVEWDRVTFIGQRGPVKEVGLNGCQVDDLIVFALGTIEVFNRKFHSDHNERAIADLRSALGHLEARRADREARGVEGRDKE